MYYYGLRVCMSTAESGQVMTQEERAREWGGYLDGLRDKHARKRRLMEILK